MTTWKREKCVESFKLLLIMICTNFLLWEDLRLEERDRDRDREAELERDRE
jgi:hypothetical protein